MASEHRNSEIQVAEFIGKLVGDECSEAGPRSIEFEIDVQGSDDGKALL